MWGSITSLVSGCSTSLHLHGMPAPHMQPRVSDHALLGWFSQTHPMPKHIEQCLIVIRECLGCAMGMICLRCVAPVQPASKTLLHDLPVCRSFPKARKLDFQSLFCSARAYLPPIWSTAPPRVWGLNACMPSHDLSRSEPSRSCWICEACVAAFEAHTMSGAVNLAPVADRKIVSV